VSQIEETLRRWAANMLSHEGIKGAIVGDVAIVFEFIDPISGQVIQSSLRPISQDRDCTHSMIAAYAERVRTDG
jgi:hypothetical protein